MSDAPKAAPPAGAAAAQEIMLLLTPLVAEAAIVGQSYGWPDVLTVVRAAADKLKAAPPTGLVAGDWLASIEWSGPRHYSGFRSCPRCGGYCLADEPINPDTKQHVQPLGHLAYGHRPGCELHLSLVTEHPAVAPPADLVALVREIQHEYELESTSARMLALVEALIAYPLPAAPRVPDTHPPSVTQGAAVAAAMDALELPRVPAFGECYCAKCRPETS